MNGVVVVLGGVATCVITYFDTYTLLIVYSVVFGSSLGNTLKSYTIWAVKFQLVRLVINMTYEEMNTSVWHSFYVPVCLSVCTEMGPTLSFSGTYEI